MKNATLALWLTITAISSLVVAIYDPEGSLLGILAVAFYVFAFMSAHRLNKIGDKLSDH